MNSEIQDIVERLESLRGADATTHACAVILRRVADPTTLLQVVEETFSTPQVADAAYHRGLELGVAEETLRGYLALAAIFEGNIERATQLVLPSVHDTRDDVLLSAWANLDYEPGEVTRRLVEALKRSPDSMRLHRQLADYSLRIKRLDLARKTHRWLLEHETSEAERERVAALIQEYHW